MKFPLPSFLTLVALPSLATAAPRLVVSTPSLVPESQIDLVLDSPAVATSELGKSPANDWLDIQPPLPGKLLWKAQNIANWIPTAPPVIGATYTFSISGNHVLLDGSAVPPGKFATLASEPFQVIATTAPNRWSSDYSPSTGEWLITFNDNVDPAAAVNFFAFEAGNNHIAARVDHPTYAEAGYYGSNSKAWTDRFPGIKVADPTQESPVPFILRVAPASPLPPAKDWQLLVFKGLPNAAATARTAEAGTNSIGEIKPFQVTKIRPEVAADEPREIVIDFNDPVSEFLPVDFLTKCLVITPRPANLSARLDGRELHLTGNLTDADKYTVTMRPPFTSKAGLDLVGPLTQEITFEHLVPELALPSNNEAQLANGSRSYRIQTVNLDSLHIRVKQLAGEDLIRAYQGYRQYTGTGPNGEYLDLNSPLPYSLVAGKTLFERDIPLDNGIDTSKEITLKWDEILPAGMRNAGFFLDIEGGPNKLLGDKRHRNAQAVIQLTDIGLAWKLTPKNAFIYAFSCDTGAPLPGVKLELFGEDASALQSAATDTAGLVTLPRTDAARHLHATLGNDSYLTAFDSTLNTVGLWHFPIRYSWNEPAEVTRKAFLFTDRSLYKPGETVRMKGIVRSQRGNDVEAATPANARIVIVDPAENEIHSSPVTLSANGSFDFSFKLPDGKTGTHEIRLEFPDDLARAEALKNDWQLQNQLEESGRFSIPLRVEEFRRNAFEIKQTIDAPEIAASTLTANVTAAYYQGQPVAAGQAKYFSRVTAENPYPERFQDYLFGNHRTDDWSYWYHYFGYKSDDDDESGGQVTQAEGEAQLSADGKATLKIDIPLAEFPTAREVTFATEVTDANHQTLTATSTTTVHPSSVYAGISRIDKLVRAGESLPLKIVATGTDGEPFPGAVKVTATLTREVNSTVKSRTDTGATTTHNDVSEETVSTTELVLDPAASAGQGNDFTVTPTSAGRHYLTVRGTDPQGRAFATVTYFNVYGTDDYPWAYEDGMRVKLVAEKKSYKPGETARVLVLSPIEGTALVTVEREKVLRSFQVQLKADNPVVEIPLTADDAPNAYVSVLIIKGAKESARDHKAPQLRLGYCELIVENLRDVLAVQLQSPESARPGAEVTVSGKVTLADGSPAAAAEITLYAEDEGTLAVMGYETPNPMDYFYKPRDLDVKAGTSFETFISEDPEQQYFNNKGFFIGGGGDLSKLADPMRKNFDPCATWAPALVADASGNFSHTFKVPDTLTRYRLIAVAQQGVRRFGQADSSLVAKKDLMLEPKTPRFANQTDTFDAQVLVQNASSHAGTWEIRFSTGSGPESPCVTSLGAAFQSVTLDAGASTTVVFPSRADHTGEAILRFQATPVSLKKQPLNRTLTDSLSDGVESRFQVHYPMPLLRQSKLISLKTGISMMDLRSQLDARLLDGDGEIELGFSRSPLVEAAGSIDYLLHYPYGCVEQTTSSLIPWISVESLAPVIPGFAKLDAANVTEAIQTGADRLLSMQLADGSFSYWPDSHDSVPWVTSYAGLGLLMAANKGAHVPPSAIASLTKNLIESLRGIAKENSPSALEIHARTLFVLALAGSPQPAYQNVLADRLSELTPAARSLLASAIALEDEGNEPNLARAKSILTSKVPFKSKDDGWMPWSSEGAFALIAWLAVDPGGPETTRALDRMLRDRNPYGHWRTTWVNGWSLMAMAQYADRHNLAGETVNLALEGNTGTQTIALTEDQPSTMRSFPLSPDLKLGLAADHEAFVRMNLSAKPRIAPIQPVATNGLSIDRTYERINSDGSATFLTEPKVGDLVRISLRVTLPEDDTRYLVIEDPLASVFETVNTDFKSQRSATGTATSENDWNVSHSELRTDRAVFFLDHISRKGTYTVTYLARCTLAGQATAPPAKVESMYNPEDFALSASRVLTSR